MATAKQKAWRKRFAAIYGGKKKKAYSRPRARTRTRGINMVRRRRRSLTRRSYGGGTKRGMIGTGGLIGTLLVGAGAASVANGILGQPLGKFTGAAAGYLVGGLAGAAAGFASDNLLAGTKQQVMTSVGQIFS